jgi:hypothetical protein
MGNYFERISRFLDRPLDAPPRLFLVASAVLTLPLLRMRIWRDFGPAAGLRWVPFALGGLALLFLRAAVLGKMGALIDAFVLYLYLGVFCLWWFGLGPSSRPSNVDNATAPGMAFLFLILVASLLLAAVVLGWREWHADSSREARRFVG